MRRPQLHKQEIEKLRRLIERPFGELLFASAVVLGDGATERSLIPPIARYCLGTRAQGLCVVDPGSMGSEFAVAVVKFAKLVGIPWLLFADSDEQGQRSANKLVRDQGGTEEDNIVWVGEHEDNVQRKDRVDATESMFLAASFDVCLTACRHLDSSLELNGKSDKSTLLRFMKKHKGSIGRYLALELIDRHPWHEHEDKSPDAWPKPLFELITKLRACLT